MDGDPLFKFGNKNENLVLIFLVDGGFWFWADLILLCLFWALSSSLAH